MRYLLDTHVMLWFLEDSPELSKTSRRILKHAENELFLSVASYWEITVKFSLGRLELEKGWSALLAQGKKSIEFEVFRFTKTTANLISRYRGITKIPLIDSSFVRPW